MSKDMASAPPFAAVHKAADGQSLPVKETV